MPEPSKASKKKAKASAKEQSAISAERAESRAMLDINDDVRPVQSGDTPPALNAADIEAYVARRATVASQDTQLAAVRRLLDDESAGSVAERARGLRALLEGASPDDRKALRRALRSAGLKTERINPDEVLSEDWREGGYPYKNLMRRSVYEREKFKLQVELLKLQSWVKETGQRLLILFEGRDAAGKGGTIKRFMEHLNPRGARVVALEKPTEIEAGQWYFQRYVQHLPARGEIVLFDRSWYNRAGVERVMGFCSEKEYQDFVHQAPEFERHLVSSGIHLIKFWFSVSRAEQRLAICARLDMEVHVHPAHLAGGIGPPGLVEELVGVLVGLAADAEHVVPPAGIVAVGKAVAREGEAQLFHVLFRRGHALVHRAVVDLRDDGGVLRALHAPLDLDAADAVGLQLAQMIDKAVVLQRQGVFLRAAAHAVLHPAGLGAHAAVAAAPPDQGGHVALAAVAEAERAVDEDLRLDGGVGGDGADLAAVQLSGEHHPLHAELRRGVDAR